MSVDGGEKNYLRVLTDLKVCQCLMMVEVFVQLDRSGHNVDWGHVRFVFALPTLV